MTLPDAKAIPPVQGPRSLPLMRAVLLIACTLILLGVSGCLCSGFFVCSDEGSGHLTISGSTMMEPVSEVLASAFMKEHAGINISVSGGDSTRGIIGAGEGLFSLGSASRTLYAEEMARYPGLQIHRIGGSAVVVIAHRDIVLDIMRKDDLAMLYNGTGEDIAHSPNIDGINTTVQRSDASGTEEIFAQWLFGPAVRNLDAALNVSDRTALGDIQALTAEGNQGVLALVRNTPGSIGFVDYGVAKGDCNVTMIRIETGPGLVFPKDTNRFGSAIRDELALQNGRDDRYIEGLTRPLLYLTNGPPDPLEEEFIRFARSPDSAKYFREAGYFPSVDFSR